MEYLTPAVLATDRDSRSADRISTAADLAMWLLERPLHYPEQ
jgi:hypothetical protein